MTVKSHKDGRNIFLAFLAFFIVFASVDIFFVYKAVTTLPGVVSENAYEIGLHYNDIIAEAKKRKLEQDEHSAIPRGDQSAIRSE